MLIVPQDFKDALKLPIKRVSGYLVLQDGTQVLPSGDLQSYTIESVGGFLRSAMSKITVTMLGDQKLVGTKIDAYYGVEYGGQFNYVLKGEYSITEAAYKKDTGKTVLTGYDNMQNFSVSYSTVGAYPTTLFNYLQSLSSLAGVALENTEIYNGDLVITEDYYQTLSEYTARDVLEDICEAAASYAVINSLGHLELRQITDTGETLTYDQMMEYELGDFWGGINSVVLSRQPQNDDVFFRDDVDINSPTTRNVMDFNKFNSGYKAEDS